VNTSSLCLGIVLNGDDFFFTIFFEVPDKLLANE
jgi:hypothetical protein